MSSSVGFLDFFILEASEYVEQLDGLLARAGANAPDADALQRAARSLRGSATMAKLPAFAELAHALERTGRSLRDGGTSWDARLRGAVVAAIDELKILLRNVRGWGDDETRRASECTAELVAIIPATRAASTPATPSTASGFGYLAGEASNVAAGLELLLTRPGDGAAASMVMNRVRALRGVAAVKDIPLAAQVLEAAEQAAHPLEQGRATLSPAQRDVLESAAEQLRSTAEALRSGRQVETSGPAARRFGDAVDAFYDAAGESEQIVPIASLFHDDAGPHVLSAAGAPSTTAAERFRLELVSQGEHLGRLADEARQAPDDAARERYRREIRRGLRAARALAESFEERAVAETAAELMSAPTVDAALIDRLGKVAAAMADPSLSHDTLQQRMTGHEPAPAPQPEPQPQPEPAASSPVAVAPAPEAPSAVEAPAEDEQVSAPTQQPSAEATRPSERPAAAADGHGVGDRLDLALEGLASLETERLAAPTPTLEQPVVPIESLVYRGRAAVRRAIEIRDEVRRGGAAPSMATIEELFDLLDLALLDEAAA